MRFLLVLLFTVTNAFATDLCSKQSSLKDSFINQFYITQETLVFAYLPYYRDVSKKYEKAFQEACKKGSSDTNLITTVKVACLQGCDSGANGYFNGALEQTKKKQNALFNECATFCNQNAYFLELYSSAQHENECSNPSSVSVNDAHEFKEIKDKLEKPKTKSSKASKQ